jgi:alkylation response protein AidB-like acyl-CoA dehydrogenase
VSTSTTPLVATSGGALPVVGLRFSTGGDEPPRDPAEVANAAAFQMIPIIELCRWSPGMVTAMGVSTGLTPAAILSKGTAAQKARWALPLLTMEKIGAWAITEPDSGSDAFGGMKSSPMPSTR